MTSPSVTLRGANTVAARLRALWPPTRKRVRKAVAASAFDARGHARRNAPHYAVAQRITVEFEDNGLTARIESRHKATEFFEFGTKPHTIRPKRRRMLKFFVREHRPRQQRSGPPDRRTFVKPGPKGGFYVFTTKVDHPGTEAQPFMGPAYRYAQRRFRERIEGALA